ncbi:bifunctional adenosylcobinamide kinase/adenosylcobinamide-phosphate guanylyltransferase [Desulforamulus hydrothermalis]|uniref:Adenosylcobinamide kinase n=1 Tax=Desulforamulus hydrothermalis Lam5 = DSM 18033 TaxID=1121428 RepID=K8ECI0_9FIRM|nr:bifunctional adenosylcobinamide kinase/adenosylcobinamide-phosphate guanylyltransferase [Desulforamulus hydrothermalis]CCO09378.1 Bifunctional adenosylcobalamin biosynthesis protein CobP [Desulforamulus hydrothermalis Lam5 = DSM 18033]SHH09385.1 adenosylcobinamide kinase /adenosylcobinamide-phosphate guanylyltransferase [Desulforamulus hydrothermalis Lam5 = DSM 18033]
MKSCQQGKLFLVLGGSRSGKSRFAENLAQQLGEKVLYLATATVYDEEMARRVQLHRTGRPAVWDTVEEPLQVIEVIQKQAKRYHVILLDCLTLWLTNLLLNDNSPFHGRTAPEQEKYILNKVTQLAAVCRNCGSSVLVVSNEVGLGIVPDTPLGRTFRDIAGSANQVIAHLADEVYFVAAGLPIALKSLAGSNSL